MERRAWLGLVILSLFVTMACSLPRLNSPRVITMRRTVAPVETVQRLVSDAIIVTPHATFTATPTPTITPTLISVAAAQGTMTPSPRLTETVNGAGGDQNGAETTAAAAATQTAAASVTLAPLPAVPSPTASTTSIPTGTTSPTSTGTTTPTGTASPSPTPTQIPPTPTATPGSSGSPANTPGPPPTATPVTPSVAFSAANYSVNENAGSAIITITLSASPSAIVTVSYATSVGGSATAGSDYTAITSTTLNFPTGMASQTFSVPILDDLLIEPNETIVLTLSNPSSNATLGTLNSATLTIVNDDSTVVNTTDDNDDGSCNAGHCSLREAINTSNANAGTTETISFAIPSGPYTITPGSALPSITDPVIIDGLTQLSAGCSSWPPMLLIELDGSSAGAGADGLFITAGNSTIRGLVINRFGGDGIEMDTGGTNHVECNYIGTDVGGTLDLGNGENGVLINNAPGNTIGGATAGTRNLISGNGLAGVWLSGSGASSNQVLGNFFGTDASGTQPLGNQNVNIRIGEGAISNVIGGTAGTTPGGPCTGACNLIADAKTFNGITIQDGHGNTVQGNYIGTDVTGTIDLGNARDGIEISNGSSNNIIGWTTAAARNLISGNNQRGIRVANNGTTGNVIQGNYIGTDVSGTADLGNTLEGVFINNAPGNTIGGTTAGARNLISGNDDRGVWLSGSGASSNQVLGNFIGTDASGTQPLGNRSANIRIGEGAVNNIIGGTAGTMPGGPCTGACNLLADSNTQHGITIQQGTNGTTVQGNYIGTDVTGTIDLGNARDGIRIDFGSFNNIIGGTTPAARNLISGNDEDGVGVEQSGTTSNVIQGNYIGTDTTGTIDLGNSGHGIIQQSGATNNIIGGTAAGAGNRIAFNGLDGVSITSGTGTLINRNSIFSNGGLGVDLGNNDVTANDPGDIDGGPNNLQNFPVLTAVTAAGPVITGTLNSTANTTFRLEFFDNSTCDAPFSNGEGETFLGFSDQTTNGIGNVSFVVGFAIVVPVGYQITATATDLTTNDTSEFSACLAVP